LKIPIRSTSNEHRRGWVRSFRGPIVGCGGPIGTWATGAAHGPHHVPQMGTISELLAQNGIPTRTEDHLRALEELGGLEVLGSSKTDNMYHAAWAWAGSSPYRSTKLVGAHFGGRGSRLPWPGRPS